MMCLCLRAIVMTMVSESEAAAIYSLNIMKHSIQVSLNIRDPVRLDGNRFCEPREMGDVILVCDAGGGTVVHLFLLVVYSCLHGFYRG